MRVESNFVTLLGIVLLSCPESETTAFISEPSNPTFAKQGKNFTLEWTYDLDGTVLLAQFFNISSGGNVRFAKTYGAGDIIVESEYQGRLSGQVTNTKTELTFAGIQRSEQLTIRLILHQTGSGILTSDVDIVVLYRVEATGFGINATVPDGGKKTFSCPVDGNPKPNISWYKGREVNERPIFRGEALEARESGCYTCVASNSLEKPVIITQCLIVEEFSTASASLTIASKGSSQPVIGAVVGVAVFVVILIGQVT